MSDESPEAEQSPRRRLILVLSIAGGVLLVVIIAILAIAFSQRPPTVAPTASPTPTSEREGAVIPSPSATPKPESTEDAPVTAPPSASIANFFAWDDEVDCSGDDNVPISFAWEAVGERLWFGVGTENAQQEPYGEFPLSHTLELDYQCGQPGGSQVYSITVQAADGTTASASVTITEAGLVVP